MKSFIVLVALFALASCDKTPDWVENSKICTQKNDVTEADVKKALTGEMKAADAPSNMKCYFLCMSEKEGFTKDGVLQPTVFVEKFANSPNKDELMKGFAACKDIKGTDNCDSAFKFMTCVSQFRLKA